MKTLHGEASMMGLGAFLRDRRTKVDPAQVGLPRGRRRTPGLRREEVALRANISVTWYTFLEQGRGGRPSSELLERLAKALVLSDVEREHLFLLGRNVQAFSSTSTKQLIHPTAGKVSFEVSMLGLDGPGSLSLVVLNPASDADRTAVRRTLASEPGPHFSRT